MGDKTIAGQLLAMKTPKGVLRTDVQMGRDAAFDEAAALVAAIDAAEARAVGVPRDAIEALADRMWRVHPNELDAGGYVHKNFGGKYDNPRAAWYADQIEALIALHPASPLGAVAMREKAAKRIEQNTNPCLTASGWSEVECVRFYEGQSKSASKFAAAIRALPTTFTDAELLAAAAELPAVVELIIAGRESAYGGGAEEMSALDKALEQFAALVPWDDEPEDLAPFARKGGQ